MGRDSSVDVPIRYGFDGQTPMGTGYSAPVQTGPGAYPAPCKMGTGSLSRGKAAGGVALTTHPLLATKLKKE